MIIIKTAARATPWAAKKAVDLGELAEPVNRYRFENWIGRETDAVRGILVASLRAEGFVVNG